MSDRRELEFYYRNANLEIRVDLRGDSHERARLLRKVCHLLEFTAQGYEEDLLEVEPKAVGD